MRNNMAALNAFAKVVKVTNHTEVPSSSDTLQLLLARFAWSTTSESTLFRPNYPCLIVKVLATQANHLEPSGYCTVIKCTFPLLFIKHFWLLQWHYGSGLVFWHIIHCRLFNAKSIYIYINRSISDKPDIGIMVRVFANGPGDLGSIPGQVIPMTQKIVLDASLLNTQHYKVWIKG